MNQKQTNLLALALEKGVQINNIDDYQNKENVMECQCLSHRHPITGTVDQLLKNDFECLECNSIFQKDIKDNTPYFLSLDAATYVTGMAIFNKKGQLLGHKALIIDKKKDYFVRMSEIKEEISRIIDKNNIQCVILEDIQYQQNPVLFKKLAMLQGIIRYTILVEKDIALITAMADEWRSYNHIFGSKRPEQKKAAIARANKIFKEDISEDESESIFLGLYGINQYYNDNVEED